MVATQPRPKAKPLLSGPIAVSKYENLGTADQVVLSILESFAPDDANAWPCDYDELIAMADNTQNVESDQIIGVITRLVNFKIIDCSFSLNGTKLDIWVSPWNLRNQLRHALNDELIARRAAAKVSPAA